MERFGTTLAGGKQTSVAQSRPFDPLVSPSWSSFSHCPKRLTWSFGQVRNSLSLFTPSTSEGSKGGGKKSAVRSKPRASPARSSRMPAGNEYHSGRCLPLGSRRLRFTNRDLREGLIQGGEGGFSKPPLTTLRKPKQL